MLTKLKQAFLFLLIFSSSLFYISCNSSEGSENDDSKNSEPSVFVKTIALKYKPFTDYISVLGTAKPFYQANLSSEEGGRIKQFYKNKGAFVKKGEAILVMDNDVLKANMDAAKARYDMAETNFIKQEKIYKENVTSELQYLNAKYERDAAKANYELMKARYEKTFIKAPFSGIIDMKYAEIGELVLPGTPIVSVVNMYKIKVEAGVPENYVNMVHVGSPAKVSFTDLGGIEFEGKVSYVGSTISTNNRTFPIEVILDNKDGKIKPELSARIFIERKKYEKIFVIPEETVTETDLGNVVFIAADGKAEMRKVDIISRSSNEAAVNGDLKEGEQLIVVGFQNLVNGEKVTVIQ